MANNTLALKINQNGIIVLQQGENSAAARASANSALADRLLAQNAAATASAAASTVSAAVWLAFNPRDPYNTKAEMDADVAGITVGDFAVVLRDEAHDFQVTVYEKVGAAMVYRQTFSSRREPISVIEFGAVGDGVTDDTGPIQEAIDSGKNLVFPDGYTFITQGGHEVTTDYQRIVVNGTIKHDGIRRTYIGDSYGFGGLFRVMDYVEGVVFEGSGIMDGNWRRAGYTAGQQAHNRDAGAGIYAFRASNLTIRGITFQHFSENAMKLINCPGMNVERSITAYDICNVGTEVHSYNTDPRTGLAWVGEVKAPSGSISGFYDHIDDGLKFTQWGNGCGMLLHCSEDSLPIGPLLISGHFRDCLAGIWSENAPAETKPIGITISDVLIEGNYRGPTVAPSLAGIGLIGMERVRCSNIVIRNVGNVQPIQDDPETPLVDETGQSSAITIVYCNDVSISDFEIITDYTVDYPLEYGIRMLQSEDITLMNGRIDAMDISPIFYTTGGASDTTNLRIHNVLGTEEVSDTWQNLIKFTFAKQDVGADAVAKLLVAGEANAEAAVVPCTGRVVAVSLRAGDNQVFTSTGAEIWLRVNGTEYLPLRCANVVTLPSQGQFATVDSATQTMSMQKSQDGKQVNRGDRLSLIIVTDGTWTAGHDIYADVWVDIGMRQ